MRREVAAAVTIAATLAMLFWGYQYLNGKKGVEGEEKGQAQMQQTPKFGSGGAGGIRQEINIIDGYMSAASGSFATSSAIVQLDTPKYTSPSAYFEVVASTSASIATQVFLRNATSSATVATVNIPAGTTAYTRLRSTDFFSAVGTTTGEYIAVIASTTGATKGIIAARIVILDSGNALSNTQTQIEVGSATTSANNTTTAALQNTKYWYYNAAGWDASPTFYAEVTYRALPAASSTVFDVSATTTARYLTYTKSAGAVAVTVEAWGPGGGGDGVSSAATLGGGGGGGGAYVRSTTTAPATAIIGIGAGGAEGDEVTVASTSFSGSNGTIIRAAGGTGAADNVGGAGGTVANSRGSVAFAGGAGGNGDTNTDTGAGGGGAAGPDGAGVTAANAGSSVATAGGNGDNNSGGAGGAAGTGSDDTCDTENGGTGVSNARGGGGGGGANGDVSSICLGGNGGAPGGGGGGSDEGANTSHLGAQGRLKLTEYVGGTGIALEQDDGNFGSWSNVKQIVVDGYVGTSTRIRSSAFTPVNGRHYRIAASSTSALGSYDIYDAKIVVDQVAQGGTVSYSETNQDQENILQGAGGDFTGSGQSFTSLGGALTSAKFYIRKNNSPTGNAVAKLYAHTGTYGVSSLPTGTALATSDNFDVSTLTSSLALTTLTFSGANQYAMTNGTNYVITFEFSGGSIGNDVRLGRDATSPTPSGNASFLQGTWQLNASDDLIFSVISTVSSGPTLLEPQYLLANTKLASGTGLQSYNTSFATAEWTTTNNYMHAVSAADNSTSVVEVDNTTGPAVITGSIVTSPDNYATSTGMCLSSPYTLDTKATTNNNDVYSSSIIVQVGVASTASCGPGAPPPPPTFKSELKVQGGTLRSNGGTVRVKGGN